MANEEHLALIKRGVLVWNDWRRNNPGLVPDLSGANLEGIYLENANFEDADLSGANLSKCLLRWARFNGAILDGIILDGADIINTNLGEILKQQKLEKQKKEKLEKQKREALEAHKRFLQSRSLRYQGVQPASGKSHRITHCWNCKEHLDNSVNFECSTCNWILCRCGACGCGYSK